MLGTGLNADELYDEPDAKGSIGSESSYVFLCLGKLKQSNFIKGRTSKICPLSSSLCNKKTSTRVGVWLIFSVRTD